MDRAPEAGTQGPVQPAFDRGDRVGSRRGRWRQLGQHRRQSRRRAGLRHESGLSLFLQVDDRPGRRRSRRRARRGSRRGSRKRISARSQCGARGGRVRADLSGLSRRRPRRRRRRRRTVDRRRRSAHVLSGFPASHPRRPGPHARVRERRRADDDRALLVPRRSARHRRPRRRARRQTTVGSGRGLWWSAWRTGPAGRWWRTGLECLSRRHRRPRCAGPTPVTASAIRTS